MKFLCHITKRSLFIVAGTACGLQAAENAGHEAAAPTAAAPAVAKPFLSVERNADGSIIRTYGNKNLNGIREPMVTWDECDSNAGLVGQVTWDYDSKRPTASMPTKKSDLPPCTKRKMSEAFANFLNENMKYCIAAASMPSTQLHVTQALAAIKSAHGSDYKKESGSGGLVVDTKLKASIGAFLEKNADAVNKEVESIAQVKLLHQGIVGDSSHSNTSYHAASVMRAIDMSHLQVIRKGKAEDGTPTTSTQLWQHNVAAYAESATIAGRGDELTDQQTAQHAFWQAYGACLQHKGGALISYCVHHTGAGLKHLGHMHVSLPYKPKGRYNEK